MEMCRHCGRRIVFDADENAWLHAATASVNTIVIGTRNCGLQATPKTPQLPNIGTARTTKEEEE